MTKLEIIDALRYVEDKYPVRFGPLHGYDSQTLQRLFDEQVAKGRVRPLSPHQEPETIPEGITAAAKQALVSLTKLRN